MYIIFYNIQYDEHHKRYNNQVYSLFFYIFRHLFIKYILYADTIYMDNYLGQPAIYAHILNGTLVFTAVIFVFWNIAKLQSIDIYKKIVLMLLISISIGIHGLSHFEFERMNKYNQMPCMRNIDQMPCMRNVNQMPYAKRVRFAV
jgi:hypothetical protein